MHIIWNLLALRIRLNTFFPCFQLSLHTFRFSYERLCCEFFKQLWLNLIPNFLILKHLLFCLRNTEWLHRLSFSRIEIRCSYDRFSFFLIACNIPAVFPIIAWSSIRKYDFVYIDRKYVNYLPLLVKILRCNLFFTNFKTRHLYYIFSKLPYGLFTYTHQIAKTIIWYSQSCINTLTLPM